MSPENPTPDSSPRALPARPSLEHLRKQAKRFAKAQSLPLAMAQRRVAAEYGFPGWAALVAHVEEISARQAPAGDQVSSPSPLSRAAAEGDVAQVRRLLDAGHGVDGPEGEVGAPLWRVCASEAPDADRLSIAEALLAAGASVRRDEAGSTPLHEAAARGPLAMVELLVRHDAIEWIEDRQGRLPLARALAGKAADREAIAETLDRPVIRDPAFRAAVKAVQTGDLGGLERLLDAEPRLLKDRILEPECWRQASRGQYFRDPKLFWFIADNPTLIPALPSNIAEIARAMIRRGVEQADLDYALGLVMTSATARRQRLQRPLIHLLVQAGARAGDLNGAIAHRELDAARALVEAGVPVTVPIAAGLGLIDRLAELLPSSTVQNRQMALAHAAINGETEAARLVLDAGAEVSAFCPVHSHATPLHHAALYDHADLVRLLLERGADPTIHDTLWNGTPWDWAVHGGEEARRARAVLEAWARR